jgi:hypothetical protein
MNQAFFRKQNFSALPVTTCCTVLGILSTLTVAAHPGHGLHEESVTHALTSPYHLLTLALLGGGLLLGATFVKRLAARRTLQITGVAALTIATVTAATHLLH